MKVAVLGGTGKMGGALAKALAEKHQVVIGSRDPAKAKDAAKGITGASGAGYSEAAWQGDVVVVALPYAALGTMKGLGEEMAGKLVISMVNPLKVEGGILRFALQSGSAAEELAAMVPKSRVATAFNNVPPSMLESGVPHPVDILVAASTKETYDEVAELVRSVHNMRPLYVGPLSEAGMVERMTLLVLNLAKLNGTGSLATKFVSRKG